MFAESLLESSGGVRTNQRWTTLFSLSLEAAAIALLVLLPLLGNQALPRLSWTVTTPVAPPPRGVRLDGTSGGGGGPQPPTDPVLRPSISVPRDADRAANRGSSDATDTGAGWRIGVPDGVENSVGPPVDAPAVAPRPPAPAPKPRPSIVTEGNVIHKVLPAYPPIARQIGAQGPVVLRAVIATDGTVESLRVVSSAHPALNDAALAAVAQWRFRPYLLNGVAVEVEAQITVNFVMSR